MLENEKEDFPVSGIVPKGRRGICCLMNNRALLSINLKKNNR
jgi:hypothetical protein